MVAGSAVGRGDLLELPPIPDPAGVLLEDVDRAGFQGPNILMGDADDRQIPLEGHRQAEKIVLSVVGRNQFFQLRSQQSGRAAGGAVDHRERGQDPQADDDQ